MDRHEQKRTDKQDTMERALRGMAKERTYEEKRRIKQEAKRRRQGRPAKEPRQRDWLDDDEEHELTVERMSRSRAEQTVSAPSRPAVNDRSAETTAAEATALRGIVLGVSQGRLRVLVEGRAAEAVLSGRLLRSGPSPAVGDEVGLERADGGELRVLSIAPRRSTLSRPDPDNPRRERVLAANVDVGVVVVAAQAPALRRRLIDRLLLALERGGVRPLVCVNKIDLARDDERAHIETILAPYRDLGVSCLVASAASGEGTQELRGGLHGGTAVLVGQSGVGKSSLLNALDPTEERATGAVRASDGKGRHTTTSSTLYRLPGGARVIDTPGVRAFGLWNLSRADLRHHFPELVRFAGGCRFRDCTHVHEPDCAVRAAADERRIPPERYATYLRVYASLD